MTAERTAGAPPWFVEPTFGRRLGGAMLDGLVTAPVLLLGLIVHATAARLTFMAFAAAYSIILTARNGQTVGKMVVDTKVVDQHTGEPVDASRAAVRWLVLNGGRLVALTLFGNRFSPPYETVILLPVLFGPLHRGLHDRVAGTVVTALA